MSAVRRPVNLTIAAFEQGGTPSTLPELSILLRPGLRCDRVDRLSLHYEDPAASTQDELYVIVAGYGGVRCEDGSLMDVTAGDVVYIATGTCWCFESLSRKFSALRLTLRKDVFD